MAYLLRIASTGSNLEAIKAGTMPDIKPINVEIKTVNNTIFKLTTIVIPIASFTNRVIKNTIDRPIAPPNKQSTMDSIKN